MTGGPESPSAPGRYRELGEDTVELELSEAEQLELARAGEPSFRPQPEAPSGPGYDTFVYTRTRRADVAGTITFAALVCAVTLAAGWHILGEEPGAHAVASAPTTPVADTAPVQPVRAAVLVPNPFDATEIFEFPADTGDTEAKTAVAELLLRRAQERREQGLAMRRPGAHHPRRVAAVKPSDVFVTKVLSPESAFTDMASAR